MKRETDDSLPEGPLDAVIADYLQAMDAGEKPDREALFARHPDLAPKLRSFFADHDMAGRLAPSAPPIGSLLPHFGDYELVEEVARGGMGIVYKARQTSLNRVVALKMILAGQFASREEVQRFHREAEGAAQLDHPHIIPIHEIGEYQGHQYFTMKYIDGGSLAEHIADFVGKPREAASLVAGAARAVHHAHQRGLLHRDLKPANLLLARGVLPDDTLPIVTDFGLARSLSGEGGQTHPGVVVGTPSYMAPEQAASAKVLGTAVDVYSLGAILYELLTGRPPFRGESALETLGDVLHRPPEPPGGIDPKIPYDLETICLKCLEKEPSLRYGSAEDLAEDLERFLAGKAIHARPEGVWRRVVRWGRGKSVRIALSAALILGVGLGISSLVFVSMRMRRERDARARAAADLAQAMERQDQLIYAARIAQAHAAFEAGQAEKVKDLLDDMDLGGRGRDLRGWEWHYLRHLPEKRIQELRGHKGPVRSVVYSPDGKQLGSVGQDGTLRIWDPSTGQSIRSQLVHEKGVRGLAWSAKGTRLITCAEDQTLRVWDSSTGAELFAFERTESISRTGSVAVGRQFVAASGTRGELLVWDANTGKLLKSHEGVAGAKATLAFDEEERIVAVSEPDRPVRLYDGPRGGLVATLQGNPGLLHSLAFSKEGNRMAAGSDDGSISWGPAYVGFTEKRLRGHTGSVLSLSFSRDGKRLLSGGADGTIRLWDIENGKEILVLKEHSGGVRTVRLRGDGLQAASGGDDGTIRLWSGAVEK